MTKIGFVGLGHMGLPMAINLLQAGYQVSGYDLNPASLNDFASAGGLVAASLRQLAETNEVIITMLQTGQQVRQVCGGDEGLFNSLNSGSLYIDCSTIDVDSSRAIHQLARQKNILAVDAPVSGGTAGARAGTLTFMVGGEDQAVEAAGPFLNVMGQKIIHTGIAGSGQAAKICNNMILGISMIAISEAFVLADHLQLSADKLFEVVTNSSGQCWAMSKYAPVAGLLENVPANNDFKPGFAAAMMLKDLVLSQESAQTTQTKTLMGKKATELYQQFVDQGFGSTDFSAIIQLIAQGNEK